MYRYRLNSTGISVHCFVLYGTMSWTSVALGGHVLAPPAEILPLNTLNHAHLALVLLSQLTAAVVRHKANDGVVYAI